MKALSAEDVAGLRRWLISGAVIVLAHGAIAAGMVNWRDEIEPGEPAAAIIIEFAPLPVARGAPQLDIARGPEQVMPDASPDKPVERVEEEQKLEAKVASRSVEEPPPEIKPAPNPDVAIEPTRQEVATPQRQEPRTPAPTTSAPQAPLEQTAALPAAPIQCQITPTNSYALPTGCLVLRTGGIRSCLLRFTADRKSRTAAEQATVVYGAPPLLSEKALSVRPRMLPLEGKCYPVPSRTMPEHAHEPTSDRPHYRCRRPVSRHRIGARRPLQQRDRAVRAGGAPVRGKSGRGADGAAIDWRTTRSPTDARLGQAG